MRKESMFHRFIEHTADIRAECEAPTFEGLLEEAARALYAVALANVRNDGGETRTVALDTRNREECLVRWLQELIFLLETEQFVAVRFAFDRNNGESLAIHASGYRCTGAERAREVKGATYHAIEIEHSESGWTARIVFDV